MKYPCRRRWLVAVALVAAACGHNIGDPCSSNVECSSLGDRFCDISAPGGYCTVEGCDNNSCPGGAVCVRFFSPIPSRACSPATVQQDCAPSERCLCDCGDCRGRPVLRLGDGDGGTATDGGSGDGGGAAGPTLNVNCRMAPDDTLKPGHCAPESSERRWCQRACNRNEDCRAGYACEPIGAGGSQAVPIGVGADGVPFGPAAQFCVQVARFN